MILACALEDPNLAILFGMLTAICAIVIYTVGMTKLIGELSFLENRTKDSESTLRKTRNYRHVILEIAITCFAAYLCLFGVIGSCMVVLVYFSTDWRLYSFPWSIPSVVIALQLILTFLVLFEWVILVSLLLQMLRMIETKKKIQGEFGSMLRSACLLLVVLALSSFVDSHMCMLQPMQRGALGDPNETANPNCFLTTGPCGARKPQPPSIAFVPGSNVTIVFQKNVNHYSASTPNQNFTVSIQTSEVDHFQPLAVIPDSDTPDLTLYTVEVTIPRQTGAYGLIQVVYYANDPNNYWFV